jgi:hypothetical protein
MSNNNKLQYFAFKKDPQWNLPVSEEKEAVDKTRQAIKEQVKDIQKVIGNETLDWVIM